MPLFSTLTTVAYSHGQPWPCHFLLPPSPSLQPSSNLTPINLQLPEICCLFMASHSLHVLTPVFTQIRFHYYVNFFAYILDSLAPFSLHCICFAKSKLFSLSLLLLSKNTAGEIYATTPLCTHIKEMALAYSLSHCLQHYKIFSHILTLTWEPSFLLCLKI